MKFLATFILTQCVLLAATLTNYSIYNRDNYLDILLNFNEPYTPKVKIMRGANNQAVALLGLISDEKRALKLNSELANELLIYPYENNGNTSTVLQFKTLQKVKISTAITSNDGFAMRVRVQPDGALQNLETDSKIDQKTSIEFATAGVDYFIWMKMIITLLLIIVALFALKSFVKRKQNRHRSAAASKYAQAAANAVGAKIDGAVILCEKPLDENNRFVVLEYEGSRYKLIIGQGNIWLNQPAAPTPASENFEQYFLENKQRLSNLIRQKTMDEYKEKISNKRSLM